MPYLSDTRVAGAQPGIDLLQQLRLRVEARLADRVDVAVQLTVGPRRGVGKHAGIAILYGRDRVGRAL